PLERRHPAAAVLDLSEDTALVLRGRDRRQVGPTVAAVAARAVTGDAVVREDLLAGVRVAALRRAAVRLLRLARVLRPLARARRRRGPELPVQAEEPEAVAVRRRLERVAGGEEGEELLAALLEDRRLVVRAGARLEAPEELAVAAVVRLQRPLVPPDEDEPARGRRRPRIARVREALLPCDPAARRVDRRQRSRRLGPADAGRAECAVPRQPRPLERNRPGLEADPADRGADVEHVRLLVVRDRLPVLAALRAVAVDEELLRRRRRERLGRDHDRHLLECRRPLLQDALHVGGRRPAVGRERRVRRDRLRRPGLLAGVLRHRLLGDAVERLPRRAVEHVEPAGLRRLRDPLVPAGVEEHDRARGVVVPDVVMDLLEVPLELPRLQVERDDRGGVEVLAGPLAAVPVRAGVAGREVDEPELRVDGRRLPDGGAAPQVLLRPGRPGLAARLVRSGRRVPAPEKLAARRVDRLQERARRVLGPDDADVDLPVGVGGRGGDRLAELPLHELLAPDDLPGALVERDHLAVELPEIDAAVADRDAAVEPAAADGGDRLVDAGGVLLQDLAGGDAHGEAGAVEVRPPHALDLRDVRGRQLRQRRVALVAEVAARGRPVVRRKRLQLVGGEARRGGDALRCRRRLPACGFGHGL